jgi:signal transduction histidine kinase
VSRKIAEFHRDLNWSEVFASARIPFTRWDFKVQEAVSVSSILIAQFWLQWLVGTAGRSASSYVGLREAAISSAGILLIARLWILEKHYFIGGLKAIFRNVENLSPADAKRSLPLHSSPLLAGFEGAYNALLGRLADYQRELSHWIQYQTEESRYQALGEISALTLHDISAPIQVIQFFAERVRESPDCLKNPEYVRQLSDNVDKAVQMIRSLRSYLADPTAGAASVDYGTCHSHVFQLLETQFRSRGLSSIRLTADPRLMPLRLKVTKVDLTHVMFNLLKNGIENLLATETSEPAIAISLRERGEDYAVLCVEDNGSGLTPERYELLTSIAHSGTVVRESMGLRLIRRVVERNQGSLTVDAPSGRGTCFLLRLPLETAGNDGPLKRFTGATSETIAGWSAPASRSEKVPAPAPAASRGSGSTDP